MQCRAVVLAGGILSAVAGTAAAQPAKPAPAPDPDALAKQAAERAGAGDFVGAAAKFFAAYSIDPSPEYLCNVGVAYQRAKIWPRAHAFLGECLAKGTTLDAEFIGLVKQALTEVEATLRAGNFAPIEIVVAPPDALLMFSTFAKNEKLSGSRTVWMPIGTHTVIVEAPGYATITREIVIDGRTAQRFPIALARPGTRVSEPPRPVEQTANKSMVPAIFATSVTVAVGTFSLVTYLKARSSADDADSTSITRDEYDDLIADARQWKHISWALTGAAVVGAGVSTFLWVRYAKSPSTLEVSPGASGATVSFATHW